MRKVFNCWFVWHLKLNLWLGLTVSWWLALRLHWGLLETWARASNQLIVGQNPAGQCKGRLGLWSLAPPAASNSDGVIEIWLSSPKIAPPTMHGWHGRIHDCWDLGSDLTAPLSGHLSGALILQREGGRVLPMGNGVLDGDWVLWTASGMHTSDHKVQLPQQ